MNWRNSTSAYGGVSIAMHWLMAVLVLAMFGWGLWMRSLGYYDVWYHRAPEWHKSLGMVLLLMLGLRWCWRMWNIRPNLMGAAWEQAVALLVHRLHYLLLLALMLTGYLIPTAQGVGIDVWGWVTVPAFIALDTQTTEWVGIAHRYLAWSVVLLASVHAAAACKHHWLDKDMTLRRMLGISPKHQHKENI